ncbi:MAG: hypothetical protein V4675_21325 [Verrucomicrobiota bacterium]
MKTCSFSLTHSLRIAVVLALLPLAAGTAQAENPFKFLGAKAKQGLSKVKQVVHPRRIGAALKNLKPAPLKPAPRVAVRPVNPSDYPDATRPSSGGPYVDGALPLSRPELSGPQAPTLPTAPSRDGSTSLPITNADDPARRNQTSARPAVAGANQRVPGQRQVPQSPAGVYPVSPALKPPAPADPPSPSPPKTLPPARVREDLPFGELVPGKTGFVISPWSKKELVDVSGIPTGTKVKCPYTGKTFRVP